MPWLVLLGVIIPLIIVAYYVALAIVLRRLKTWLLSQRSAALLKQSLESDPVSVEVDLSPDQKTVDGNEHLTGESLNEIRRR